MKHIYSLYFSTFRKTARQSKLVLFSRIYENENFKGGQNVAFRTVALSSTGGHLKNKMIEDKHYSKSFFKIEDAVILREKNWRDTFEMTSTLKGQFIVLQATGIRFWLQNGKDNITPSRVSVR